MKGDINFNLSKNRVATVLLVQLLHWNLVFRQHSVHDTGFCQTFGRKHFTPLIHSQQSWLVWEKMHWLLFSKKEGQVQLRSAQLTHTRLAWILQ